MKLKSRVIDSVYLLSALFLCQGASFNAQAHGEPPACQLLVAGQVFDGVNFPQFNMAVLIEGDKIRQVGSLRQLRGSCKKRINLGDATILPGFIESHAHVTFQNVNRSTVLEHGITTVQDTGGPLMAPLGGHGELRLLSTGPIIQAQGGYPLNIFGGGSGDDKIGYEVASVLEAEDAVQRFVDGGATAVKIALEPGGETGAPWMMPHGDNPVPTTPWNMLSEEIVQAIVTKAHALNKRVIAHVGEDVGFERALNTGVDEFAHMPCAKIRDDLLQRAVDQGVTFVTTVDTLSACQGIYANMMSLAAKYEATDPGHSEKFIYGSEIAHDNVPWGINGEEMHLMLHLGSAASIDFSDVVNVFKAATSKAGEHLGLAPLGTLAPGAPADLIAVRGNPFQRFKFLEYPDLVMSGGHIVVNKFKR